MDIKAYCYNPKFNLKYRVFKLTRRGNYLVWVPSNSYRSKPDLPRLPVDFHFRICVYNGWEVRDYKEGDI